jgi:hypothetical protein
VTGIESLLRPPLAIALSGVYPTLRKLPWINPIETRLKKTCQNGDEFRDI